VANRSEREVALKHGGTYEYNKICAVEGGPRQSLLQAAAREAFFTLPATYLRELCDRLEVDFKSPSLIDLLRALIAFALPAVSDEEILNILDKRTLRHEKEASYAEDLCSLEWVGEQMDRGFGEALLSEIKDSKATQASHDEFTKDLVKLKVVEAVLPADLQTLRTAKILSVASGPNVRVLSSEPACPLSACSSAWGGPFGDNSSFVPDDVRDWLPLALCVHVRSATVAFCGFG
jgi:hypothetical protein